MPRIVCVGVVAEISFYSIFPLGLIHNSKTGC